MTDLHRGDKAEAVMSLLGEQTNTGPKKLIEEVGAPEVDNTSSTEEVEEPSMMEMMMAAQLEAKRANDAAKEKERAKQAKKFGGGFKKGFFGGDSKPTKKKSTTSVSATQRGTDSSKKSSVPAIPPPSSSKSDIPTIAKKETANSLVMDDVQEAMKEDNPLLNKIKEGGKLPFYFIVCIITLTYLFSYLHFMAMDWCMCRMGYA